MGYRGVDLFLLLGTASDLKSEEGMAKYALQKGMT